MKIKTLKMHQDSEPSWLPSSTIEARPGQVEIWQERDGGDVHVRFLAPQMAARAPLLVVREWAWLVPDVEEPPKAAKK